MVSITVREFDLLIPQLHLAFIISIILTHNRIEEHLQVQYRKVALTLVPEIKVVDCAFISSHHR